MTDPREAKPTEQDIEAAKAWITEHFSSYSPQVIGQLIATARAEGREECAGMVHMRKLPTFQEIIQAEQRGREEERKRCVEIAQRCAAEREATFHRITAAGVGNSDAVHGKWSEAERIAALILEEPKS